MESTTNKSTIVKMEMARRTRRRRMRATMRKMKLSFRYFNAAKVKAWTLTQRTIDRMRRSNNT